MFGKENLISAVLCKLLRGHLTAVQFTLPEFTVSTKRLCCACNGPVGVPGVVLSEDINFLYCSFTKQMSTGTLCRLRCVCVCVCVSPLDVFDVTEWFCL